MKNIFITTIFLVASITINAQNKANPIKVNNKAIYALLINTNKTIPTGKLSLTKEQLNTVTNFENRIQLILKNAPTDNYDAISTRDGITVQFLKYQKSDEITEANIPNYFGKEVYFLSNPIKDYSVIKSRLATTEEIISPFYYLAKKLVKVGYKKKFDAIIVNKDTIEYIKYK